MKKQLTICGFSLLLTASILPLTLSAAASTAYAQTSPSQAYFLLADEIANLFQQLEKLPTAQASALLRQKAPSLQARIKQVRPAYLRYLKSLPVKELRTENERIATSNWGKYFAKQEAAGLDANPKLKALLKPGSPSGQTILDLMGIFDGM